ncbi:MAG: hypothetical protein IJL14_07460 [Selenomonadaceae bacterium]|nr:hypothetical protein [Selenomonadaceae bacterium]
MPDYYVARINYGKPYFDDLREELIAGRYRQGWGNSGCDLRTNTAQTFPYEERRYNMLSRMLDIKPGDRIIIPKVSVNEQSCSTNFFTIAVCTAPYSFAPFLPKYDDYGHIIEVDVKGSWIRYFKPRNSVEEAAQYIVDFIGNFACGKFDIAINVVDDNYCEECFKKAVEYLIDPAKNLAPSNYPYIRPYNRNGAATQDDDNSNTSYRKEYDIMPTLEDLIESNLEQQRKFWQGVLNILQTLQPDDVLKAARSVCAEILEEIVVNLFKNNGFNRVEDDNYLIFERNTIEDTIYEMNGVDIPKIYVLIEKSGVSYAKAFAQLEAINTRVFISLTEKFRDDIKTSAKEDHIMLINGQQFAELVIKYASKSNS